MAIHVGLNMQIRGLILFMFKMLSIADKFVPYLLHLRLFLNNHFNMFNDKGK